MMQAVSTPEEERMWQMFMENPYLLERALQIDVELRSLREDPQLDRIGTLMLERFMDYDSHTIIFDVFSKIRSNRSTAAVFARHHSPVLQMEVFYVHLKAVVRELSCLDDGLSYSSNLFPKTLHRAGVLVDEALEELGRIEDDGFLTTEDVLALLDE